MPRNELEKLTEGMSVEELLRLSNDNSLHGAGAREHWADEEELNALRPLFRDPATPAEIAALEARLRVTLPEDYKAFLRVSNGFSHMDGHGIYNGYFPDPPLYRINEVAWDHSEFFHLPMDLITVSSEVERLVPRPTKEHDEWGSPVPLLDGVISIGVQDIDNLWLVPPEQVARAKAVYLAMLDKASDAQRKELLRDMERFAGSLDAFKKLDWCCFKWSSGGSAELTPYPSFKAYLQARAIDSASDK